MGERAPKTAGYEFADDIAIADVAFRARGPTLEALFEQAARATTEVMVDDLTTVTATERREVALAEADPEMLLFELLQELIYYKDAEELLLLPARIDTKRTEHAWEVRASLAGERIDPRRHPLNADVKAVTMHRFAVRETADGWEATVVLDI